MQRALRRARSGPPNNEIWSGVALNTLCDSIKRAQLSGMRGPLVPIDPNVLQHINLNGGTSNGSAGMFKNGGQLQWPLILQTGNYKDDRAKIDELSRKLFQQATSGQVDADTLFGLKELVERLSNKIDEDTPSLSMNQSIQATRFINELKTSLRAMQDPNVTKQFNGQWSAQGNNVAALVDNLANKGLSFSSATPGNETYYTSLYNNFLSYDMALSQLASAKNPQVQTVPQPQPNR